MKWRSGGSTATGQTPRASVPAQLYRELVYAWAGSKLSLTSPARPFIDSRYRIQQQHSRRAWFNRVALAQILRIRIDFRIVAGHQENAPGFGVKRHCAGSYLRDNLA